MNARRSWIYILLLIPLLVLTGCGDTVTTEEQRAILIPAEDGSQITFRPPPPTRQEQSGQVPPSPAIQGQGTITPAQLHNGFSGLIPDGTETVLLPEPQTENNVSLEASVNTGQYTKSPLAPGDISQLLWAAQSIAGKEENRTAPSISSTYPLALYLITENVTDLTFGCYVYIPAEHELVMIKDGNTIDETGLQSDQTVNSAAYIIVAADFEQTDDDPGDDIEKPVYLEAGRIAQNIYLQATSLGLDTIITVNFNEEQVENAAGIPVYLKTIYVMPVWGKADP